MYKIYIVEDDENIRDLVSYALKTNNFRVGSFERTNNFWNALKTETPDLIILDVMLPLEDGISILKQLKENESTKHIPVILLTAKNSEYDKVKGLDLGADDYITKPFSILELVSRIKAILRRCNVFNDNTKELSVHNVTLNPNKRMVTVNKVEVMLTFKEFELLHFLMDNPGIVMSRDKIMRRIWGTDFLGETRTVDMHIKTLRQKLGAAGSIIHTVRGVGYKVND